MNPFSLLVKPSSADCNLRCDYCFYLDRCALYPNSKKHRMSNEVLECMIQKFMETDQPQHAIGWQGGEPGLMGLEFFEKVTAYQKKYGSFDSQVSNGLQTNGTLIDDAFAGHLAKYNFLVGVSVDGPKEVHDHYRKNADGQGSHEAVLAGIESLKKHSVEHNILTLVSQSNVRMPGEIYHYLCDMGVVYHQYIECIEFGKDGSLMPFAINGEEWGDFLCAIFDEWIKGDAKKVSVRLFDSILMKMVEGGSNSCTMSELCNQYLVVEHNGDIYPCDFFVEQRWKLGNILTDSWEEMRSSELYEKFGVRKKAWNEECATCEYLKYCAGCCPKNRPMRGNESGRMSVLCGGWKRFYKHSLKKLRMLANEIEEERSVVQRQGRMRQGGVERRNGL